MYICIHTYIHICMSVYMCMWFACACIRECNCYAITSVYIYIMAPYLCIYWDVCGLVVPIYTDIFICICYVNIPIRCNSLMAVLSSRNMRVLACACTCLRTYCGTIPVQCNSLIVVFSSNVDVSGLDTQKCHKNVKKRFRNRNNRTEMCVVSIVQ
jgi:hypothetical protein